MSLLKVTAILSSPLATNEDLPHLDGILTSEMSRKKRTILESINGGRHAGIVIDSPGSIPIPIETRRVTGFPWPIPLCSNAIIPESRETADRIAKRFPAERSEDLHPSRRIQINTTGGENKSYYLPVRVIHAERVVWYCVGRGRPQRGVTRDGNLRQGRKGGGCEIRKLLRGVAAIGDRTNIGYGRVRDWIVEPTDLDIAWFAPSEAGPVLMRSLPASMPMPDGMVGDRAWFGGVVPPYWGREYYAECVVPC